MRMTKSNVLIKIDTMPTRMGRIELPDEKELRPDPCGTVVAVGPEARLLRPGNKVWFGTYEGQQLEIEGEDHIILKEEDVAAVFVKEGP